VTSRGGLVSDWLGRAAWLTLLAGGAIVLLNPASSGRNQIEHSVLIVEYVLFGVLIAQLLVTALSRRQSRAGPITLAVSLVAWSTGSSILSTAHSSDRVSFPGPGEGFFLIAYALMAAFLVLDDVEGGHIDLITAVQSVVTVGGTICVAGMALIGPVSAHLHGDGASILLALLYPLIDLLLAATVLGDLLVGRRRATWPSGCLLAGFALQAVCDSFSIKDLAQGRYDFDLTLEMGYGLALVLLVTGACGPRGPRPGGEEADGEPDIRVVPRRSELPPLGAALVAAIVLTLVDASVRNLYLIVPAALTLASTGVWLRLALGQARTATEAYRLSLTDDLTGLPNRRALHARLQQLDDDTEIALLLLDLDGFKEINDTLGHVAGDQVLQLIGTRLATRLPEATMVARLGGDEFAVALLELDDAGALMAANMVRRIVAGQVEVHGHTFTMDSSVGIATSSSAEGRADLLRRADIAMYQAKTAGEGALRYDPDRDEFTTERLKLAELLRTGIPAGQLRAWYQPQVAADTRELVGLETLVRWEHPELGVLAPGAFLPLARQIGLMPLITETVIGLLLADVRAWLAEGTRLQVAFNIAPPELLNTALLQQILAEVDDAELPPGTLTLEVTEDSLLADPERARQALLEISRHQVQISIDDYGTGFSSLSYLRDLPVDELKLDRSFIADVRTDPRSRIIVASTNQMAQGLGLRTVAEGVEDAEIAETVAELGINVLQGYHIARPMPAEAVPAWVADWRARIPQQVNRA
jgi:diguanylate cyclase (GGDEF)-like protein